MGTTLGGSSGVLFWESYLFGNDIDLNGFSIDNIGLRVDRYNSTPDETDVGVTYIVYGSPVLEPTTLSLLALGGLLLRRRK